MSTQPTTQAQGGPGTFTGILNSVTTNKVNIPFVGSVSILAVAAGIGLLYFGVFHKKQKYAVVKL